MDFRGRPEQIGICVGVGGIRTRYQADGYVSIRNKRTFVNLSGTAIISKNLLPPQMRYHACLGRFLLLGTLILSHTGAKQAVAHGQKWRRGL